MTWEKFKLGDIIEIKKGKYITKKESKEGPYPVILGGQEPAYYIDTFNHTGKAIVVSRSGASAGYVSFWNEPIFVTDGFLIEPKGSVNIDFLYYLMKFHQPELHRKQGGAAIPHVNPRIINAIEVKIPHTSTQKQIVAILSAYSELIENNSKRIKLLEQMAENLYKEWFVRFRFPNNENTEFENGIPKGWEYVKFEDILSFERGISYSSEEIDCEDGLNLINLKNIDAFGGFRRDGTKKYNGKYKESQVVKKGDLVIGVTDMTQDRRTVGAAALIPTIEGISVISADLVKVVSDIPNIYLYCLCRYGFYSKYFSQFANGANVLHLKPGALLNKKVLLPTNELIDSFVEKASAIIELIDELNLANDNLIKQRDLLLPRLMSGKLEV